MKVKLLFTLVFAFAGYCYAQKPKASPKEKVPTQAEMQQMMNEVQQELNNMSPEDKKIMEEMGIKVPDVKKMQKNVAGVTDAQLKEAYEDETRLVPVKDMARIAAISSTPLTVSSLPAFVSSVHSKVITQLTPAVKTKGEELYQALTSQHKGTMGNIAAGLWMAGRVQLALYVMGKASIAETGNDDNINNYAAMLSMCGGEQFAVPMLNYLNRKFPGNSTVLNNLGQAWFGMGDIVKAEKCLDSAIRFFAAHPQANYTKSFIEESKGHTKEAVDAAKRSVHNYYSEEKESRLRKLGYTMTDEDAGFPFQKDADPLGFGGFGHPPFPVSAELEVGLKKDWAEFRDKVDAKLAGLETESRAAQERWQQKQKEMLDYNLSIIKTSVAAGRPTGSITLVPLFLKKAALKMKSLDKAGGAKDVLEQRIQKLAAYPFKIAQEKEQYEKDMETIAAEDLEQTGEGLPNKDFCPRYRQRVTQFLAAVNPDYEKLWDDYLAQHRVYYGEQLFWMQYAQWPEEFEMTKLAYQAAWLQKLRDIRYAETGYFDSRPLCITRDDDRKANGGLANFDDVACQYHSEMNMVVFKMQSDCSRMTTTLNTPFLKLGLKQDMDKETFGDQFISCTVEAKAKIGASVEAGPIKAGGSIEGGAGVEIGRDGVSDAWLVAGGSVKAGPVKAGVEGKVSIISGKTSVEGKGILSGLKK